MKYFVLSFLIILFSNAFISCSEKTITQPDNIDDKIEIPEPVVSNGFILVLHGEVTAAQEQAIIDSLVYNCERIKNHLKITSMPVITVEVWAQANSANFYSVMENRLGQVFSGATGFTPSFTEMFMLYNSTTPVETVHEYAHLASLQLNSTISNNPRWLWEAVAQYEARMFTHPRLWSKSKLDFPGFPALNQYNSYLPYDWGYFISACIITNWGDDKFVEIIEQNGNIQSVLGISSTEFGSMVEQYVRNMLLDNLVIKEQSCSTNYTAAFINKSLTPIIQYINITSLTTL